MAPCPTCEGECKANGRLAKIPYQHLREPATLELIKARDDLIADDYISLRLAGLSLLEGPLEEWAHTEPLLGEFTQLLLAGEGQNLVEPDYIEYFLSQCLDEGWNLYWSHATMGGAHPPKAVARAVETGPWRGIENENGRYARVFAGMHNEDPYNVEFDNALCLRGIPLAIVHTVTAKEGHYLLPGENGRVHVKTHAGHWSADADALARTLEGLDRQQLRTAGAMALTWHGSIRELAEAVADLTSPTRQPITLPGVTGGRGVQGGKEPGSSRSGMQA